MISSGQKKLASSIAISAVVAAVAMLVFSAPAANAEGADAAALWAKHCASCHGKDGKGKAALKTQDLTDAAVKAGLTREKVVASMKVGVKAKEGDKLVMKPYTEKLSEAEIEALTDYTMALK